MGGWAWSRVASLLRERGARCCTPTLTGLGDRAHLSHATIDLDLHVEDVINACRFDDVERPWLVGHSYGGLVAAGVAERLAGDISGLVILDGFVVSPGQSAFSAYPEVRELLNPHITASDPDFIQPLPVAAFDIRDERISSELARKLRPMPLRTHTSELRFSDSAQRQLRRVYLRCTEFPIFAATATRAAASGWSVRDIRAGHMALFTHPDLVAEAMLSVVK